jgi:hypothetical protein
MSFYWYNTKTRRVIKIKDEFNRKVRNPDSYRDCVDLALRTLSFVFAKSKIKS